ncbi:MAG: hypothetical protein GWN46_11445, partial [Gammaproteobacteria bacterium]|nr:hypothetical protein [Gammaproteobacteria bacterium]
MRRWQFVGGKFVGLMAVLGMNLALMSLALAAVLLWHGEPFLPLLPAIG